MKLLYITNGITGAGGLERVLSVKTSMLAEDFGYTVHILSLNEGGVKPFFTFSDKVVLHSAELSGNPVYYFFKYKIGIQKMVSKVQPEIICVCDDGLKGFFLPYMIRTEAKWIYESHASVNLGDRGRGVSVGVKFQHSLKQVLGKAFSKIVLLTESNKKEWALDNLVIIPNPLPFRISGVSSLQSKKVIAVGSFGYNKGYDLLLKIWRNVETGFPDWELDVYGKGTYENLLPDADKLGLQRINFHQSTPDIATKYLESSIFVLPSRSEGFGMVIIEAMSCGLPVVSFNCPHGPGDIITDGKDGFLIENGNNIQFAQKLQLLMANADLRLEFGSVGKKSSEKYLPQKIVRQWDDLFTSLVQSNN